MSLVLFHMMCGSNQKVKGAMALWRGHVQNLDASFVLSLLLNTSPFKRNIVHASGLAVMPFDEFYFLVDLLFRLLELLFDPVESLVGLLLLLTDFVFMLFLSVLQLLDIVDFMISWILD